MSDEARKPDLHIAPEPSGRDRDAIAAALAQAPGRASVAGRRSAWWRAGVRESVIPPAPAPPRRA